MRITRAAPPLGGLISARRDCPTLLTMKSSVRILIPYRHASKTEEQHTSLYTLEIRVLGVAKILDNNAVLKGRSDKCTAREF